MLAIWARPKRDYPQLTDATAPYRPTSEHALTGLNGPHTLEGGNGEVTNFLFVLLAVLSSC